MYTPTLENIAHRLWELRGWLFPAVWWDWREAEHNWEEAERLRHQLVEEAAYFRWLDRGQLYGDSWRDWFAAEAEVVYSREVHPYVTGAFVDQRLRHQLVEEAAYFRWLDRWRFVAKMPRTGASRQPKDLHPAGC